LKAGTYSLLTIPSRGNWTIIVNSDVGMWGSYNYNIKQDILRFDVSVETLTEVVYEPFTILIDQKTDKATISLLWDKTKVTFPIQFQEPK
jgi:F0F1-type ATP synthase gamma subunit